MNPQTDEEILLRAVRGNEEAFAEIYRRYHVRIHRFAIQMSAPDSAAEEITQDVFVSLLSVGKKYDPRRGALAHFLLGIARNYVRRWLQKNHPHEMVSIEDVEIEAEEAAPLRILTDAEGLRRLQQAIFSLAQPYREVVVLCELQEMRYED